MSLLNAALILSCLVWAGCGKSHKINAPADGTTINASQGTPFMVTVDGDDYNGVTIERKGGLPPGWTCTGGTNTYMYCMAGQFGGGGGNAPQDQSCTSGCTTIFLIRNGDNIESLVSVNFKI